MNTYESYSSVTQSYSFPSAPTAGTIKVSVYYENDLLLVDSATPTLVSGTTYQYSLNPDTLGSFGTYSLKWQATISDSAFYDFTEFKIEDSYVALADFVAEYPEFDLPEYTARYASIEKMARRIVDTYTGQNFQFIKNKIKKYEGNNREQVFLNARLVSFSSVFIDESDYTTKVTFDFKSRYYLKLLQQYPYPDSRRDDLYPAIFPKRTNIYVTGDWGWPTVPWEIQQATSLLMTDLFNDVKRESRRYGVTRMDQDTLRLHFDPSIFNSTGNIDVDTLLMDFVLWNMDYVY